MIDLHLSFEKNTSVEDVISLKKQMQQEFDAQLGGKCVTNIIVSDA